MKIKCLLAVVLVSLVLILSTGTKNAIASATPFYFEKHIITDIIPYGVATNATDIDNDGDIDILGTAKLGDSAFYLYINEGNNIFTPHLIVDFLGGWGAYQIDSNDVDNDGDIDIAAFLGYTAYWFENDGNLNFSMHTLAYYGVDPQFIKIIDFDGDGDSDFLTIASGWSVGHVDWFENDGNENFIQHEILNEYSADNKGCIEMTPIDMESDGDIDLVLGCADHNIFTYFWLENDGDQNFNQRNITRPLVGSYNVLALDMDNDSDVDVLGASCYEGTYWWENDGSMNFIEHRISSKNQVFSGTLEAADMDHDGDIDVVEPSDNQLSIWINDGQMNFNEEYVLQLVSGVRQPFIVNMDGDGDEDIIILLGGYPGGLSWYEQKQYNLPPTIDAGGPYIVAEGSSIDLTANGSDPEGQPLIYAWDLDADGIFETAGENATYTAIDGPTSLSLTVKATDNGGLTAIASTTMETINVNPTAILSSNSPLGEASTITVSFDNVTDASTADVLTGLHYAFTCDGGSLESATYETSSINPNIYCAFDDGPSTQLVRGRVIDKDDGYSEHTTFVDIINIPPTIDTISVSPETSIEGATISVSAAFTDLAGNLDAPYTCTINYGDGSGNLAGTVNGYNCVGPVHIYPDFGIYNITVNVIDKDGGVGSKLATHNVIFDWYGFFQPIDNLPVVNVSKSGSTIPIKFSLNGYQGPSIFAIGSPAATRIMCEIGIPEDEIEIIDTAGTSSLTYSPSSDTYHYGWKTDKVWAGTCWQLTIKLIDGTLHTANFKFK